MHTAYDIKGLVGAVETREALEQAEYHRLNPTSNTQNTTTSTYHTPIYNQKGELFAGRFVKKNFALIIPPDVEKDTLIEYKSADNRYYYGVVVKTNNARGSAVTVKELSPQEAVEHKKVNKTAPMLSLSDQDAKEIGISNTKLAKLLAFLDPAETLIFKIFTFLLMKGVFDQTSATDMFISVYTRLIILALLLIISVYLSTVIF